MSPGGRWAIASPCLLSVAVGRARNAIAATSRCATASFSRASPIGGLFAEYVGIHKADLNLVALPENMDFATAASLGCRFATSFRAVVDQGKVSAGQWVAVHGCGGVGLSAVMIAHAIGANVIAIDICDDKLKLAQSFGAVATVNASRVADVTEAVLEITKGGAHVSLDALGHPTTCFNSINNLRRRGRHVQVGLMLADHSTPAIPMSKVIAYELEICGSHGMQAHRYGAMMEMITSGKLAPENWSAKPSASNNRLMRS